MEPIKRAAASIHTALGISDRSWPTDPERVEPSPRGTGAARAAPHPPSTAPMATGVVQPVVAGTPEPQLASNGVARPRLFYPAKPPLSIAPLTATGLGPGLADLLGDLSDYERDEPYVQQRTDVRPAPNPPLKARADFNQLLGRVQQAQLKAAIQQQLIDENPDATWSNGRQCFHTACSERVRPVSYDAWVKQIRNRRA